MRVKRPSRGLVREHGYKVVSREAQSQVRHFGCTCIRGVFLFFQVIVSQVSSSHISQHSGPEFNCLHLLLRFVPHSKGVIAF